MYYVYLLQTVEKDRTYIGYTSDSKDAFKNIKQAKVKARGAAGGNSNIMKPTQKNKTQEIERKP